MATLNNSDVTSFRREKADDFVQPYLDSTDVRNVEFAKSCYEELKADIQAGYHHAGLSLEAVSYTHLTLPTTPYV